MAHKTYLSYEEYVAYGGTLPLPAFTLLELRCRKRIDLLTASRVQNMGAVPEAVKLCMMSLIGIEGVYPIRFNVIPVVTSFSTDGYSESYGKAMGAQDAVQSMNAVIGTSLYGEVDDDGVPLLYRGTDR